MTCKQLKIVISYYIMR